jgi:hypothetical protein
MNIKNFKNRPLIVVQHKHYINRVSLLALAVRPTAGAVGNVLEIFSVVLGAFGDCDSRRSVSQRLG